MSTDTGNGGSITPGGRFDRMEQSLLRIETKLDSKVSTDVFQPLVRRVELLESGETPLGKILLEQFTHIQSQVAELTLHGSQNAQLAAKRIADVEICVAALEKAQEGQAVLANALRDRDARSLKVVAILVSAVGVLSAAISTVALVSGHL